VNESVKLFAREDRIEWEKHVLRLVAPSNYGNSESTLGHYEGGKFARTVDIIRSALGKARSR
jgi:hypothetical protein